MYSFSKPIISVDVPVRDVNPKKFCYFDTKESLLRLLDTHFHHDYFIKKGKIVVNEHGDRVYSTPETGNWWNNLQVYFCIHKTP